MIYGMSAQELSIIIPILIIRYGIPLVISLLLIIVLVLAIRRLRREERASKTPEKVAERKTLGEVIASHRSDAHMTQEFVAQQLGVSRQAVSKWESGATEPSTTNLMALARLFEMEPADLLREVTK